MSEYLSDTVLNIYEYLLYCLNQLFQVDGHVERSGHNTNNMTEINRANRTYRFS